MDTWLLFILAFCLGTFATWCCRALAWKLNFVNKPNGLVPQHTTAIAYMGGIGIYVGLLITIFLNAFLLESTPYLTFIIFALAYSLLGLYDDLAILRVSIKLLLQFIVTAFAVYYGVFYAFTDIYIVDFILSFLWILVMINAVNLTDVCDGLVGSITVVALICFFFTGLPGADLALITAGATAGFLVFNKPPASIFMGDAGTHLLGFSFAYLALTSSADLDIFGGWLAIILLGGVFLFELTFLIVVRTQKGLKFWLGSQDHFCLRLQAHGYSKFQTDLWGCTLAIICAIPAILVFVFKLKNEYLWFAYCIVFISMLLFWRYLLKIEKQ